MPDYPTPTDIANAKSDMDTLAGFVTGGESDTEVDRFSVTHKTIAWVEAQGTLALAAGDYALSASAGSATYKAYATKSAATADVSNIPADAFVQVAVDESLNNDHTLYQKQSGSLVFQTYLSFGKLATGSAAAPSLSFIGDTNTGFFNRTGDKLSVAAAGSQVAEFRSGGMNIGTTTARGALNIVGDIYSTGNITLDGSDRRWLTIDPTSQDTNGPLWGQGWHVFTGINSPASSEPDTVMQWGWNVNESGRISTSLPQMRNAMETLYHQGGTDPTPAMECHLGSFTQASGSPERRFISLFAYHDGSNGIMSLRTGKFDIYDWANNQIKIENLSSTATTLNHNYSYTYSFEANNTVIAKQKNAANNAYLSLPYYNSSDELVLENTMKPTSNMYFTYGKGPIWRRGNYYGVGTFTLNGTTEVTVTCDTLVAGDMLFIGLNTKGGTPGPYTVTDRGTGWFKVKGTAGDTSTMDFLRVQTWS